MQTKPIDKTKKSNRRCQNCVHYDGVWSWCNYGAITHRTNYWNRCERFEWSTQKQYKEDEK